MIEFKKQVASARQAVDAARSAFQVAPMMLGAGGPRDYLVLVQNPAELRSTGGLPGNWTLIHADNGTLTIRASDTSALLAVEHPADLTLSADETALFGAGLGVDARDINVDPDFPRVAQIAASKYLAATGVSVSAVFAMDPQALAYVLEGTGPIAVTPSQGIDPGNVVKTLTNTIYMTLPKPAADAFNTAAAHAVFSALVTGQGDELKAIRGLVTAASQQRVLAWSPVPEIARAIGTGSLAGALPGDTGRTPQVGVYLNDAVQGKPDYYLDQSSAARSLSCVNGVQRIEVTTTLRSTMPGNAAHLPPLVVGDGHVVPPGTIALGLYVVAPWDGAIESVEVGGTRFVASAMLNGRPVAPVYLTLQPGEEATITSVVRSAKGQTGDGRLAWTPGVSPTPGPVRFASRC